jgi:hypothetical protein
MLLRDVIAGRYCGVLLQYVIADVVAGHYLIAGHYSRVIAWRYFGTLLRDVIAGRYCGTLWGIIAGFCGTFLRDVIAGQYCGMNKLGIFVGRYGRVIAGRYCGALLRDVIAGHYTTAGCFAGCYC